MSNQRYRNIYLDGCSHFCTATTVNFCPLLDNDQAREMMLAVWDRCRTRFGVRLEGFVIMPEHIHLVVRGSADGVRKFMQYSLAESSRRIRSLIEVRASRGDERAVDWLALMRSRGNGTSDSKVWKERFRTVPLDREDAILVKLEYIHNNPVRRGLVERPDQWPWSSWYSYNGGDVALVVDLPECCGVASGVELRELDGAK
jgi:putative transposase